METPMQISVSGKPTKVSVAMCRKAARYYAHKLLSKRMYDNITIRLVFDPNLKEYATCIYRPHRSRSFTIYLRSTLGTRMMLLSLAHEMVHLKQWVTGELKSYYRYRYKWQGTIVDDRDEDYKFYWLESPWERDANGRELGLYRTFLKEPEYALCRL